MCVICNLANHFRTVWKGERANVTGFATLFPPWGTSMSPSLDPLSPLNWLEFGGTQNSSQIGGLPQCWHWWVREHFLQIFILFNHCIVVFSHNITWFGHVGVVIYGNYDSVFVLVIFFLFLQAKAPFFLKCLAWESSYSLKFRVRRWGSSLPGVRTRDSPLSPPST